MKKLLVLALVMGVASLASAGVELVPGLEYTVDTGTQTVTLTGTDVISFVMNFTVDSGVLSNGSTAAAFTTVNYDGMWAYGAWLGVSAANTTAVSGDIFSIQYDAGATAITLVDSVYTGNAGINFGAGDVALNGMVIEIPEPATMALLSLGGLFLARRKK